MFWTSSEEPAARVMDPVWYWADLSEYRGYQQGGRVRLALELRDPARGADVLRQLDALVPAVAEGVGVGEAPAPLTLQIAPHYRQLLQAGLARFFTARVPLAQLQGVAALVHRVKLGLIGRVTNQPLDPGAVGEPPLHIRDLDSPALRGRLLSRLSREKHAQAPPVQGLEFLATVRRAAPAAARQAPASGQPLMAVIDFGCAFAHPAFRSRQQALATRVRHFWDQGRPVDAAQWPACVPAWPWARPDDFAYGREATGARLDALMQGIQTAAGAQAAALAPERFEEACYVAAGLPELLRPWSHGTAVLGLAAGWPHAHAAPGAAPDAAAESEVIFVQLPEQAVDDLSGGWVTPYLLDALSYVQARRQGRPVVINLCIGSHAGPHDGASLLEAALDACAAEEGVTVVLAAGNAAGQAGHAVAHIEAGAEATLQWVVPGNDPTQTFLELWYDRLPGGEVPRVGVEHPQVQPLSFASAQTAPILRARGPQEPVGALIHLPQTTAGRDAGMALLALAPTTAEGAAPSGAWTVRVGNPSAQRLTVHAWVERDEPGAATLPGSPSSVLVAAAGSGFRVDDAGTLTAQATGRGPLVVGGYLLGWPAAVPTATSESGRGPARAGPRLDVDALAPSNCYVQGLSRGLAALGNLSATSQPPATGLDSAGCAGLAGTSLAAPWVARQAFNAVSADPTLRTRQAVCQALRARAVEPPIVWTPQPFSANEAAR